MKPRSDVCDVCETYRHTIKSLKGRSVEDENDLATQNAEIDQVNEEFKAHLKAAEVCRIMYEEWGSGSTPLLTIDFAQNVHLPNYARHVGPLFYVVPIRVNLLGILHEQGPIQHNFIIDEGSTPGADNGFCHSVNVILTCLQNVLDTKTTLEDKLRLQMDNCAGQNKNHFVMWFLVYVLDQHPTLNSVEVAFMLKVHTRCRVDSYFGNIKKRLRETDVASLDELELCICRSATANECTSMESGTWTDWRTFCFDNKLGNIPNISKLQRLVFKKEHSQITPTGHEIPDDPRHKINLRLPTVWCPPKVASSPGLSLQRFNYLMTKTLPHVHENDKSWFREFLCGRLRK